MKEADDLLDKGDIIQASEKYYKAAEEAIKILAIRNSLNTLVKVKRLNHWTSKLYFKAVEELRKAYSDINISWISAWLLHIEGFHEARLSKDQVKLLKENVKKLIDLL
ncbi:MAG: PaREP1 family protein [Sulfolobaceae archaeon]|nr:PaREP1 family protein [Sulfolobaceae archaeon]